MSHDTPTNADKVAETAADIYELVRQRNLLISEQILAGYIALAELTRSCGCTGCRCGEIAHERASGEMRGTIGDATIQLFDLELEARGY